MKLRLGLFASVLLLSTAHAEVEEQFAIENYVVSINPELSLGRNITAASPIREDGQAYHGQTAWQLSWRYTIGRRAESCSIVKNQLKLNLKVTLPVLGRSKGVDTKQFADYRQKLYAHEMNHVRIVREHTQLIDEELMKLPAQTNCNQLKTQAQSLFQALLEHAKSKNRHYDDDTGHGQTEGAWIE